MDTQQELEDLISQLGEFGRYQIKQHVLHCLAWFMAAVHMMGFFFVFPTLEHRCYIEDVDGCDFNQTSNSIETYIPVSSNGKLESCLKYQDPSGSNETTTCDNGYVYNSTYFVSSRITEWEMVCGKTWMRALLQSIFLVGNLTGAILCGILADRNALYERFGRKPIFCISGIIQCICGVAGAFIHNYIGFAVSMFFYGLFGASGSVVPSVALTMEIVGPSKRNICGTMFTVWFGLGAIIVASWAYFLPIDAKYLQLIYGLHSILLFGHSWFMDESICWLWTNGKKKEALRIAEKAVKCNGGKFEDRYSTASAQSGNIATNKHGNNSKLQDHKGPTSEDVSTQEEAKSSEGNVGTLDLFRYPKLRQRTLVMLYCWFASNLTYFGLSFNSVNLFGNPILMFIINILVELPAHFISMFVVPKTGNKPMFFISMLATGAGCIIVALLSVGTVSTCITMMAKVTATICFNVINSYTAELFPTSLRNTAIGLCIMTARSGAAIIPEINLLTTTAEKIPTITFGTAGILASLFVFFMLPETMNRPIPQTIEDVEKSSKEQISDKNSNKFSNFELSQTQIVQA